MENYKQKIAELMKADKYADAFIYCGKALRENPHDQDVRETAAFIFQRINDAHIEIEANTAEEYTMRGIAYFYAGEIESSIYDYSKAIEQDETYDYAYKCRHFSYAASGKINESLKDIIKAIQLNPTCGLYYFDCANLLSHLPDKKPKSLDYYNKSVELEPTNFEFWYNFGIELEEQKYYLDAIQRFEKVLELNPEFIDAQMRIDRINGILPN